MSHNEGHPPQRVELHGFSDTSQQSYSACIFLKSIFKGSKVSVHLIASKSSLAPIKETTIPRLELLGNLILSRLMNSVKSTLSKTLSFYDFYFWADSKVTLAWISAVQKEYKTFVENRVQEIRKTTDLSKWFYCKTKENPADLLTRSKIFKNFHENKVWFQEPEFLKQKSTLESRDFQNSFDVEHDFSHELKTCTLFISNLTPADLKCDIKNLIDISRYSSVSNLYRVTA